MVAGKWSKESDKDASRVAGERKEENEMTGDIYVMIYTLGMYIASSKLNGDLVQVYTVYRFDIQVSNILQNRLMHIIVPFLASNI
jgi:hypothetical protein